MIKQLSGQEKLDGFAVESYEGRVAGSFDIAQESGRALAYGDEVLIVIQASVKPPTFKVDSNGDLKRVEVFAPNEAEIVVDSVIWGKIEDITGVLGTGGQTRLFNPRLDVDYQTGEIPQAVDHDDTADWPNDMKDEEEEIFARQAARDRTRAAAAEAMDDDDRPYGDVERVDLPAAGSKDPVLRRFLEEMPSGR